MLEFSLGGFCKEMVRNKETLSINWLLPSMMYYSVFSVYNSANSSYWWKKKKGTELSVIWNITIQASSLFCLGHLFLPYLSLWLFSRLIHTKANILSGQWATGMRVLGRALTAHSDHDPGHEQPSWFSLWVHMSQPGQEGRGEGIGEIGVISCDRHSEPQVSRPPAGRSDQRIKISLASRTL